MCFDITLFVCFLSDAEFIDFGVDQLDIKKKMKAKLGPDVVLRLKFNKNIEEAGDVAGSKGYAVVATSEDQVELEMVPLGGNPPAAETESANTATANESN